MKLLKNIWSQNRSLRCLSEVLLILPATIFLPLYLLLMYLFSEFLHALLLPLAFVDPVVNDQNIREIRILSVVAILFIMSGILALWVAVLSAGRVVWSIPLMLGTVTVLIVDITLNLDFIPRLSPPSLSDYVFIILIEIYTLAIPVLSVLYLYEHYKKKEYLHSTHK